MAILVTGAAGYIGSHVALALLESGEQVLALDNLSTGSHESLQYLGRRFGKSFSFVQESLGCKPERLKPLLVSHGVESVVHLAASVRVGESVSNPLLYYRNNVVHTQMLLDACLRAGVKHFVFSSSAAVYGNPSTCPVAEDASLHPESPYGSSKAMAETILKDVAGAKHMLATKQLSYLALRYFNVAGTDPAGYLGYKLDTAPTHLVRAAIAAALGKKNRLGIFGSDYPTKDGTCVRDYVHVCDIADAHVAALRYLRQGSASAVLNCGYGKGYTVLEVVESVKRISGNDFKVRIMPRRLGDPASVVADAGRLRKVLDWRPKFDDLDTMVAHQFAWENKPR
ncbi:MAG TPA: UDP-glucose 4-epimerase GalE [Candidatus Paceibacterota bacterium]|jgi:UDP-glucose 4-epimerase|nr:UDP-glucose 4-epimerase GalE [Candidatus Paceibacterota bacterium]